MTVDCYLCGGKGRYENPLAQQTLICPLCHPIEADQQALSIVNLPSWGAYWTQMAAAKYGPLFQVKPDLIVLHSGSRADCVAEYFARKNIKRQVSAHFAWSRHYATLCQCVPLNKVAWHAGGSKFQGKGGVNWRSIGIELPGPWDKKRDEREIGILRGTIIHIMELVPSVKLITRHSDINPNKKDPGPGFNWKMLDGLGLNNNTQ